MLDPNWRQQQQQPVLTLYLWNILQVRCLCSLLVMSTISASLSLVSEAPSTSGVTTVSPSVHSPTKNTTSSIVTIPAATDDTQIHNMPVLSEVSAYEVSSLGTPAMKLLVPLSSVTSIHRSVTTSMQNIKSVPSKESAVAFVCSLASKNEPSSKVVPLPSVLPNLREMKESASNPVSVTVETSNIPVNSHETSISLLSLPSKCKELTGFIKVNENHKQIYINKKNCLTRPFTQYPLHVQNANVTDVGHVVFPVTSKLDDNQIIIPLTSGAIYSQPIGISIPLSGSGVPVQVPCENITLDSTRRPAVTESLSSDVPVVAVGPNIVEVPRDSSCNTTSNLSEIPATTTASVPVTSVSISTSVSASMVITTHSTSTSSVEPTVTTYSIQSPAEILSQLSRAGVLPTMSSSQVSSVLSALGSDTCHLDLEADGTTHVELLTQQQVLHVPSSADKVSTLTQTDEFELMRSAEMHSTVECSSKLTRTSNTSNEAVGDDTRFLDQILNHPSNCSGTDAAFLSPHVMLSSKPACLPQFSADETVQETDSGHSCTNCTAMMQSETSSKPATNLDMLLNQSVDQESVKTSNSEQVESARKRMSNDDPVLIKQEDFIQKKVEKNIVPKRKILNCINERLNSKTKCSKQINSNKSDIVSCYKCICCPFLSLDMKIMASHVQKSHSSQELHKLVIVKCPGCENIFYSSKSLKVHLVQDHCVQDEELKAMVSLSIKSASKSVVSKRRKLKPNVNETQILMPNGFKSLSVVSVDAPESTIINKVVMDETSKIRVRNLNKDATSVSDITNTQVHEHARDETNLTNNGASEGEIRDGILVIDDDPLLQQRQAKLNAEENCELKIIKTDAETAVQCSSELVLREEVDDKRQQQQEELKSSKKKRGRPKGSKNILSTVYKKMTSSLKPGEKPLGYRCDIDGCAVRLRSHDNIEYHRRCHNKDQFCCPECSQEARHWNGLSTHLWRNHLIDMELYSCDQCDYKTNSFSKLMNLHHRIHGDERPFLCDICGKGFKNPKQMRNHKAIHVAKLKQKLYPLGECDICGRTFTSPRMLRLHKDNVHGKLRPHLCNFCGYSASSRSTLKMHMRKHTGEKPFQCEQCSYQTSDHNSLRRHKMRHSGDKPYKCPHCSYACIQSSTYKAHLKTKHPGQETGLMFSCNICSFRSVRRDNYMAHMADHDMLSNSSSKSKKYNCSKPQNPCIKTVKAKEESKKFENSAQATDPTTRNNSTSERTVDERRLVKIPSDSVIHLVEDFVRSINSQEESGNIQTLCVTSIDTVPQVPLTLDIEAEEITGDIQHTKEPEEHKYTVTEDIAS